MPQSPPREAYLDLVENMNEVVYFIDEKGIVTYISPAIEHITGYPPEEIIGRQFEEFIPEKERLYQREDFLKVLSGERISGDCRILTASGEVRWVHSSSRPVLKEGVAVGLGGVLTDITERRWAEEALRENLCFLQRMLDTIPNPIFYKGRSGLYLGCNKAFEDFIGRKRGEIIGLSVYDLMPEDVADRHTEVDMALLSSPGTKVYEAPAKNARGISHEFLINKATYKDADGAVAGIVSVLMDITDRKLMEMAIQKSKEFQEKIINAIGDPLFVKDRQHRFVMANDAMCKLIGHKRVSILGRTDHEFFPEEQVAVFSEKDDAIFESGEEDVNEEEITDAQGQVRSIITKRTLYADLAGRELLVGVIRDITDRKRAEEERKIALDAREELLNELESKNAEMERFIYTISHDLRSPLVTINGFVGFLRSDLARGNYERVETDLRMIGSAISNMDRLLSDTLELSRIGRVAGPPEIVPFREIAIEAADRICEMIRARGVRLEICPDLPKINADRMRIVEALTNLLENSVKYMGDQPRPEITVGCRTDPGSKVFYVKDNGIGIDKSLHEKVFGLFYKIDKRIEGSGAGLAIVKRIIEVHGGRIWIESELGMGCTVCFTLPGLG